MPRMPWKRLNKASRKRDLYINANHQAKIRRSMAVIITYPDRQFRYWPTKDIGGNEVKYNPFKKMEYAELEFLVQRDDFFDPNMI